MTASTAPLTSPQPPRASAWLARAPLLLLLVVAVAVPLFVRSATYLHILILLLLYAYLTTSWNLVGGFAGVLPLGHAAFVGIGAYTSTVLSLQYGVSPWLGMIVGGLLSTLVGVLLGLPTFKMRGAYFALATIAFAEGLRVMVENIDRLGPFLLNGPRGLQIPPLELGFGRFMFAEKEPYYYRLLARREVADISETGDDLVAFLEQGIVDELEVPVSDRELQHVEFLLVVLENERGDLLRDVRREGLPLDLDQKGRFEGVDIHAPVSSRSA